MALHPETRHGGDRTPSRKVYDFPENNRFTADTAARTGRSERVIQLDATRGERIPEAVLQQARGTEMDKGIVLDALPKAADPAAKSIAFCEIRHVK